MDQWDLRYGDLCRAGLREPSYGGTLRRHVEDGDRRLLALQLDNSAAALRLWNFLLTEEQRLRESQLQGKQLVGVLKDLGTVPVMACSLPNVVAFYPDGAWWIPCIMQRTAGLLEIAEEYCVVYCSRRSRAEHVEQLSLSFCKLHSFSARVSTEQPDGPLSRNQRYANKRGEVLRRAHKELLGIGTVGQYRVDLH